MWWGGMLEGGGGYTIPNGTTPDIISLFCPDPDFVMDIISLFCPDPDFDMDIISLFCPDPDFDMDIISLFCPDPDFDMDIISLFFSDPDFDPKEQKKLEKELKKMEGRPDGEKKNAFRVAAKTVSLASKLSPKSQRKKEKSNSNTAQLKVRLKSQR